MNKTILDTIKSSSIRNNTQRVAAKLLNAQGQWIPRSQIMRIPSGTARVRDLRKSAYGAFNVECKSSDELNKRVSKKTYYYRIDQSKVTKKQISALFSA
jgi:hypothetical protein